MIKKKGLATKKQSEPKLKSFFDHAMDYLRERRGKIAPLVMAVVVIGIGIAAYTLIQSNRDAKASALLSRAYEYYSPSASVPADYNKALEQLMDIKKNYAGTKSAAIAGFYAAGSLVKLGRMDEALKEYKELAEGRAGGRLIAGLAYQRMGYLLAGQEKYDEAIKAFESAERLLGAGPATMELARLYEQLGKKSEAEKKYKTITERLPGTRLAFEAMPKIQPPQPAAREK